MLQYRETAQGISRNNRGRSQTSFLPSEKYSECPALKSQAVSLSLRAMDSGFAFHLLPEGGADTPRPSWQEAPGLAPNTQPRGHCCLFLSSHTRYDKRALARSLWRPWASLSQTWGLRVRDLVAESDFITPPLPTFRVRRPGTHSPHTLSPGGFH